MTGFQFEVRTAFSPATADEVLRAVPEAPGVFCLRGERETDEPYLMRAGDLRRRLRRLLEPPAAAPDGSVLQSKRLNLRERVRSLEYTVTGSEFESLLLLYNATSSCFGLVAARKRLKLYPPYFLRLTLEHSHPRVYPTNRLSARGLARTYGPFPSRMAAERYCDAVLDLFRLRRCWEDLEVHAEHPGCAYGEMKKCMAPCNLSCSAAEYAAEAAGVEAFFRTHGESMLAGIAAERERASDEMDFEAAAAAHERYGKVKAAAALADALVRPVGEVRAVVVQKAAGAELEASVFLLEGGELFGPERLSTLGVRAVKEQTSVGSSLFAQPLMLQAVPLVAAGEVDSPEVRAGKVLERLGRLGIGGALAQVSEARPGAPGVVGGLGLVGGMGEQPTLSGGDGKDGAPGVVGLREIGGALAQVSEARPGAPGVVGGLGLVGGMGEQPTLSGEAGKDGAPRVGLREIGGALAQVSEARPGVPGVVGGLGLVGGMGEQPTVSGGDGKDGAPGVMGLREIGGALAQVSEARPGAPGVVRDLGVVGGMGEQPTLSGEAGKDGAPGVVGLREIGGALAQVSEARPGAPGVVRDLGVVGDHLALFRRWYYRPEKQRAGECFLPNPDGSWPVRRILRGAARMALGEPKAMAETDRAGVEAARTRVIHEGREGVERVVPVLAASGRRGRRGKALTPSEIVAGEGKAVEP